MSVRPITRAAARAVVAKWHSHHTAHVGETLALGWFVAGDPVACVVMGRPSARLLDDGVTWEVTRLCIGPDAPPCAASRLLGAASRAAEACGVRRLISYTRIDERGTCYKAANWHPAAVIAGREWSGSNKPGRWLPGLYTPSTEIVDRVRWERGPDAAPAIEIARAA